MPEACIGRLFGLRSGIMQVYLKSMSWKLVFLGHEEIAAGKNELVLPPKTFIGLN
jgi:hypothetical protein